jgi:hypothetical protein
MYNARQSLEQRVPPAIKNTGVITPAHASKLLPASAMYNARQSLEQRVPPAIKKHRRDHARPSKHERFRS